MYAQIFLVTSVRGSVLAPQIATNSGLRVFGAKMPFPALIAFKVAFVTVVFVVLVGATVVFVVVVIA